MEILPNEILLDIFSYLEWFDTLTCFWSLNMRFNSLVCLVLSTNDNLLNPGLFIEQGLSYNKFSSILFPLILNSSSLCSSIQRIYFDGTNSITCDLIYELLFNDKKILRFPNLKSLVLTRCGSIEAIVENLSYLIEHQLDELTLTFDEHVFNRFYYIKKHLSMVSDKEKQLNMIKQFLCQLFSRQCQLKSLRLDISYGFIDGAIHRYLPSNSYHSSNLIQYQLQSYCMTLRRLHIRLNQICFFENLIEYVPNLEEITVEFDQTITSYVLNTTNIERLSQSNQNWLYKVPKLRCFSLKTFINNDSDIIYLKWLLNNMNYIEKLQLHLRSDKLIETKCQNILKSFIDANFIRQYCLPDIIPNLIYFNFYIYSQCQLSFNDIERITNSFKIHSFFIEQQWTNVKCLFDPIVSCQHLFSFFTNTSQISDNL
ncbi:unnamed protein product, partial [Rotaria sp. Silwood1]